jgi:steroid delta-isomerase-like uncharacterized protein
MESNKEIIRVFVQATNNKQWELLDELVAEDFTRHSGTGQPSIKSLDQLKAFHQAELLTFPDISETILQLIEENEFVAARMNFKGTQSGYLGPYPPTGKVLNANFICIFRIAEGKIKESWVEYDNLNGLIQLGHYKLPENEDVVSHS